MSLYQRLCDREEVLAVVGLGYVGLPLAIAFASRLNVIGFDSDQDKISKYISGIDITEEVGCEALRETTCVFTNDENKLQSARVFLIAVPTPISQDKTPDLSYIIGASRIVGRNMQRGSIVVFESTVYPGVTEDICVALLEQESGLQCGTEFKVGYSPERINPGDKTHRLDTITKIVSGMDEDSLEEIARIYEMIVSAGVFRAKSIKVAEAAKVIENSQRDINIAFMNEVAMVFDRMGIDTGAVIEAMNTKWNALGFYPGLVGGHCIGVDPYYFVYQAENLGYHSQIVSAGRRVNDGIPEFVAINVIKQMIKAGKMVRDARVAIFGITFKEDCPDIRNSKVVDVIAYLLEYGIHVEVVDPVADGEEALKQYSIPLVPIHELGAVDAIVIAVAHKEFRDYSLSYFEGVQRGAPVVIDVKGMIDIDAVGDGTYYWRL